MEEMIRLDHGVFRGGWVDNVESTVERSIVHIDLDNGRERERE